MAPFRDGKEKKIKKASFWGTVQNRRVKTKAASLPGLPKEESVKPFAFLDFFMRVRRGAALVFSWVVMAVAAYGIFYFVYKGPHFLVKDIQCSPLSFVSEQALLQSAGVRQGDHLFRIRTGDIERKMAQNPWVKRVRVYRRIPNGLYIHIEERMPRMVVDLGASYFVDGQGIPFKLHEDGFVASLPILTGFERSDYVQHPDQTSKRFRQAIEIVDQYRSSSGRPELKQLRFFEIKPGAIADVVLGVDGIAEVWMTWDYQKEAFAQALNRFDGALKMFEKQRVAVQSVWLNQRVNPNRITYRILAGKAGGS